MNGMETKLSQAEACKMREKFQSELNEMAKVFVHACTPRDCGSQHSWKQHIRRP